MKTEFCSTNGYVKYAGVHLVIELWNATNLNNLSKIKQILEDSVNAIGATLLKIDLHEFSPSGGVSGMVIIQESHLSIHTWPEYNYAALDIFVCGNVDPYKAIPVIKKGFKPGKMQIAEMKRGIL